MFFSRITSKSVQSAWSASDSSSYFRPSLSLNFWCEVQESRDTPITWVPAFLKAPRSAWNCCASTVHPEVMSFG